MGCLPGSSSWGWWALIDALEEFREFASSLPIFAGLQSSVKSCWQCSTIAQTPRNISFHVASSSSTVSTSLTAGTGAVDRVRSATASNAAAMLSRSARRLLRSCTRWSRSTIARSQHGRHSPDNAAGIVAISLGMTLCLERSYLHMHLPVALIPLHRQRLNAHTSSVYYMGSQADQDEPHVQVTKLVLVCACSGFEGCSCRIDQ